MNLKIGRTNNNFNSHRVHADGSGLRCRLKVWPHSCTNRTVQKDSAKSMKLIQGQIGGMQSAGAFLAGGITKASNAFAAKFGQALAGASARNAASSLSLPAPSAERRIQNPLSASLLMTSTMASIVDPESLGFPPPSSAKSAREPGSDDEAFPLETAPVLSAHSPGNGTVLGADLESEPGATSSTVGISAVRAATSATAQGVASAQFAGPHSLSESASGRSPNGSEAPISQSANKQKSGRTAHRAKEQASGPHDAGVRQDTTQGPGTIFPNAPNSATVAAPVQPIGLLNVSVLAPSAPANAAVHALSPSSSSSREASTASSTPAPNPRAASEPPQIAAQSATRASGRGAALPDTSASMPPTGQLGAGSGVMPPNETSPAPSQPSKTDVQPVPDELSPSEANPAASRSALESSEVPQASLASTPDTTSPAAAPTLAGHFSSSSTVGELAAVKTRRAINSKGVNDAPGIKNSTATATLLSRATPPSASPLEPGASVNSSPVDSGGFKESRMQPRDSTIAKASSSGTSESIGTHESSGAGANNHSNSTRTESVPHPLPAVPVAGAPNPSPNAASGNLPVYPESATPAHPGPASLRPPQAQPSTSLPAWQNYDGGAGNVVRSAALSGSGGVAEIRVDLASGPLGPVQLHTVLRDGSVGAEIHVQDQAAHSLLSAGMPSLERSLQDRNLHVQNLAVLQNNVEGGMGGFNPKNSDSPPHNPARNWNNRFEDGPATATELAGLEFEPTAGGLSVQA